MNTITLHGNDALAYRVHTGAAPTRRRIAADPARALEALVIAGRDAVRVYDMDDVLIGTAAELADGGWLYVRHHGAAEVMPSIRDLGYEHEPVSNG